MAAKGSGSKGQPAKKPARAKASSTRKTPAKRAASAKAKTPAKPTKTARKPVRGKAPAARRTPRGGRLPSGAQYLRDSLILQRHAQGWPWEAIAAEAGITVRSAEAAAAKRREQAPLALQADPLQVVEDIMLGLQTSIGDFEALTVRYQDKHPSAAVGAKKAANEARNSVLVLLQATGRLPEDLVTLRHLIEQRQMAVTMLDTMERFAARIAALPQGIQEDVKADIGEAVAEVERVFHDLIGLREGVAPLVDRGLPAPSDEDLVVDGVVSESEE